MLELGAGLGLPGLTCAHVLGATSCVMTDGSAAAVARLSENVKANDNSGSDKAEDKVGCAVLVTEMQWSEEAGRAVASGLDCDVVIAADVAYPLKDNTCLLQMFKGMLTPPLSTAGSNEAQSPASESSASALQVILAYGWRDIKAGKAFVEQLAEVASVTELRRTGEPSIPTILTYLTHLILIILT